MEKSKYEPLLDRVLIQREIKTKTAGGVILDHGIAKRHARCEGVILALGETAGWVDVPEKGYIQTLEVGQKVMFGRHSGAWVDATYTGQNDNDDGTLFICAHADILAVIKD